MKKFPYTIAELSREIFSTIPEKTDRELYFPLVLPEEGDQKVYILSGKWLNLENPYINVGPIYKQSLLENTNPDTLRFKMYFKEEDNYIQGFFSENKSLLEIDSLPITPGVSSFRYIFHECENLETLNLRGFDLSGVHDYEAAFQGCSGLKNIIGPFSGISRNIDLSYSPLLTLESILVVFDALVVDHDSPRLISVSEETYNLLNQEQLSIPESKGWEVIIP